MIKPPEIEIKKDYNLRLLNTMGVDVQAAFFVEIESTDELISAMDFVRESELPFLILGGGSNVLFTGNFNGIVIHNRITGERIVSENGEEVIIEVMAGENWHDFVLRCVERNFGGIENLSLIPGTVGAAPIQNIGAYGVEIKDILHSVNYIDAATLQAKTILPEDCNFGYRNSIFKNELKGKVVITSVVLRLQKKPKINVQYRALGNYLFEHGVENPDIKEISDAVIAIRQSKLPDPKDIGNTGSFFKNPVISLNKYEELKESYSDLPGYNLPEREVKIPAAWLIDRAGWKGKRVGDAGVHKNQALVLVNHGNATGSEIYGLSKEIQQDIFQKFGIMLDREVNIIN